MNTTVAVPELREDVRKFGKFDVNACLSCGTCTVLCDLTRDSASFPRRPIQYTALGLKQPLLAGLEPWLCHDCGDCSTFCPRQAQPAESMATLRRYLVTQYDPTRISSRILRSGLAEITSLALVALVVLVMVVLYHLYYVKLSASEFVSTAMPLEHMFGTITYFTYAIYAIPVLFMIMNLFRMHRLTMRTDTLKIPVGCYFAELKTMIVQAFSEKDMRKCPEKEHHKRWLPHLLLVSSCVLMSLITCFFLKWFQTDNVYPLYHPQRWLGYIATAIMVAVPARILIGRLGKREPLYRLSEARDLILPVMLLLVALSGIAVHVLRYLELSLASHFAYAIHLAITVPVLVIEVPFGRLSHMVYRPLAIYFQAVKERAAEADLKKAAVA